VPFAGACGYPFDCETFMTIVLPRSAPLTTGRLLSIDALRGLVILFMLLDHVRETFLLHRQVSDPMDIASTEPALFFSRTPGAFVRAGVRAADRIVGVVVRREVRGQV
jgi:hypothetical protein